MSLSVQIQKQLGAFHLNVSFETSGDVLGFLGASGCGKSYTLKCIAGIETPDAGRIVLDGQVLFDSEKKINLKPQQRRVGYLFQNYALFPNMTVCENILCGLHGEPDRHERERLLNAHLDLLQLRGLEQHRPHQLSGGQAQRVALARILVNRPKLLMLDEPFSALDAHLREKLQLQMQDLLKQFGKDVLLVTHSRDEAYHLCHRIAVLHEGKLLTVQDTKQLFADPQSVPAAVLTGCKNIAPAGKIGEFEVEVPQWGIRLRTAKPVGDHLQAVGIRAHYFHEKTTINQFPVTFTGGMEEPFETILEFRYPQQDPDSPALWWRIPKDKLGPVRPQRLGIAPVNVLLLYG